MASHSPGIRRGLRGDKGLPGARKMAGKSGTRTQEGAGGQGHIGHVVPPPPQSLQYREWEAEEVLQGLTG